MTAKPPPPRIVVVGGGVAALETILALRALAGRRPAITLLTPDLEFAPPAPSVASPFGFGLPPALPLGPLATSYGRIRVKFARTPDGRISSAPEYEDCAQAARRHGVALREVYRAAERAAEECV